MPRNQLAHETSPYLLQHADNPVDWMPWSPEALARAQAEKKPVLLSVGYAACHWCHVMAHESFEDPAIAAVMNEHYVNIKVDREERPDLDAIYQTALSLMGQPGGWPLTMFLTPEGDPFWGGTYFPPRNAYGRPGFPEVLRAIAQTYTAEPDKVRQNVAALRDGLRQQTENRPGGTFDQSVLNDIAQRLAQEVDRERGGIGTAPKFPQSSILTLLWRGFKRTGDVGLRDAVTVTLTRMCQGGIYDHLGGGFARYTTDADWLVPHFEKMLYDNAQLVQILTLVWQETRDPLYAARVRETIGWVLREMAVDGGGLASTLDADSEGEEGRYYVWTEAEIDKVLGDRAPAFKAVYGVTADGNWEDRSILTRGRQPGLLDDETEAALASDRERLLAERAGRIRPGWDDKVLADWNGLMIAALAEAGQVFDEPDWLAAARAAFAFVSTRMTQDGRLLHSWRHGQARHMGTLDDYAAMSQAALALFEATGDAAYVDQAKAWTAVADNHYWDEANGGYFFTADDAETLIVRTKSIYDNAVPSGNGLMLGVLTRLFFLTGERDYGARAEAVASAFSGELARNFFPLATYLNNIDLIRSIQQVVIVGPSEAAETGQLVRAVLDRSLTNRVLVRLEPNETLPDNHPAAGKGMLDGRPAAYVCVGMTCQAPVTEPAALAEALVP